MNLLRSPSIKSLTYLCIQSFCNWLYCKLFIGFYRGVIVWNVEVYALNQCINVHRTMLMPSLCSRVKWNLDISNLWLINIYHFAELSVPVIYCCVCVCAKCAGKTAEVFDNETFKWRQVLLANFRMSFHNMSPKSQYKNIIRLESIYKQFLFAALRKFWSLP